MSDLSISCIAQFAEFTILDNNFKSTNAGWLIINLSTFNDACT